MLSNLTIRFKFNFRLWPPVWFLKCRLVSKEFLHVLLDLGLFLLLTFVEHKRDWNRILRTVFNDEQKVLGPDVFVLLQDLVRGFLLYLLHGDVLPLAAFDHDFFVEHERVVLVVGYENIPCTFKHVIEVVIGVKTVVYLYPEVRKLANHVAVEAYEKFHEFQTFHFLFFLPELDPAEILQMFDLLLLHRHFLNYIIRLTNL